LFSQPKSLDNILTTLADSFENSAPKRKRKRPTAESAITVDEGSDPVAMVEGLTKALQSVVEKFPETFAALENNFENLKKQCKIKESFWKSLREAPKAVPKINGKPTAEMTFDVHEAQLRQAVTARQSICEECQSEKVLTFGSLYKKKRPGSFWPSNTRNRRPLLQSTLVQPLCGASHSKRRRRRTTWQRRPQSERVVPVQKYMDCQDCASAATPSARY
jgi:hypothetical protein